jgi:hypothetical protein
MPEGLVKVQLTAANGQIETVWARPHRDRAEGGHADPTYDELFPEGDR